MKNNIDCFFIGNNEMDFAEYEKIIRATGDRSGAYRDLSLNFVWYNNKPYTASGIFNLFYYNRGTKGKLKPKIRTGEIFSNTIAYLGTFLNRRGLSYDYINSFQEEKDELANKLKNSNILVIAVITTLYVASFPIIEIVNFIRKYNKTAKIVIGGPFVSTQVRVQNSITLFHLFENIIGADVYVNSRQGEKTLANIIQALKKNQPLDKVKNIYFKPNGKNDFIATPNFIENNKLSENMVRWDLFSQRIKEMVNIRTSISCPFSCAFCGFPQHAGQYQFVGVDRIEYELNQIQDLERVKFVYFIDDTFNIPGQRFKEILKMMIKNKYRFQWISNFRCHLADREMVELMKESGCKGVFLGIESGNDQILKNMKKAAKVEKLFEGVSLLREYGIITMGSVIVGFPGETIDTAKDTIEFIENSGLDFYRAQLWYCDPITPIWKDREKYNLTGSSFEWQHTTMDSKTASQLVEDLFINVKNSVWIPQYYFDFSSIWLMMLRGMGVEQIKNFLSGFSKGIKENLILSQKKEISLNVIKQLKKSFGRESEISLKMDKTADINKESIQFNY